VSARLAAALTVPPGPAGATEPDAGVPAQPREAARPRRRVPPDGLTHREGEVLQLIGDGLSNAEIATALFIEQTTVKTHINNAFAKIGARNRADAVRYVYRNGLTRP